MSPSDDDADRTVDAAATGAAGHDGALGPVGGQIGRFVPLELLGQGGMGMVLAAYDPELDRKVALKLLRPGGSRATTDATERLLREARAMAKLAHPCVIAVHEVGRVGDQVFIAMEFAAGGTLRAWEEAAPRPWRDVVAMFAQAGRGLAAAHAIGLIHRDFKPENVLLTRDAEVRVADFGIVTSAPGDGGPTSAEPTLTATGALMGTPAYMAPEQHARGEVGAAADQFAFCVALWEALFGARPFPGQTQAEIARQVAAGEITEPAEGAGGVPAWLRAIVRRGLARDPTARWPSMDALLAALAHDPDEARRRRWRVVGIGAGAAVLIGVAVFGLTRAPAAVADKPCLGLDAPLAGVWDPARADQVRAALVATGRPYAAEVAARVIAGLDAYRDDWAAHRVATCEATARGAQSAALLDLRMTCLDQRLVAVDTLAGVLGAAPTADVLDRADDAVTSLPRIDDCDDAAALQQRVPLPADPAARAEIERLDRLRAQAKALEDTGQFASGLTLVAIVTVGATRAQHAPLLAESLRLRGLLEERIGDLEGAARTFDLAELAAADARDDALAVDILADLVFVVGHRMNKADQAASLERRLDVALRRATAGRTGDDVDALRAHAMNSLGLMYDTIGKRELAKERYAEAIALWTRARGADHPETARSIDNLGTVHMNQGNYAEALRLGKQALDIHVRRLGPDHPDVALVSNNLGNAHDAMGEHATAKQLHSNALAIWTRALGADNVDVGLSHINLAAALRGLGELTEARTHADAGIAIWEAFYGTDGRELIRPLGVRAEIELAAGDLAEARADLERSLAIVAEVMGPGSPFSVPPTTLLGDVAFAEGKLAESRALQLGVVNLVDKLGAGTTRWVAAPLEGLARAELALGHRAAAVAAATRALDVRLSTMGTPLEVARVRFLLARALEDARARELATEARATYAAAGPPYAAQLAEIDAWLSAAGGSPPPRAP